MMPPWTDAEACGCCGQKAYGTDVFHYLETWGIDRCAGDPMGFTQRKKRLLCAKCGEAALKAVTPVGIEVRQDVGITCVCGHNQQSHIPACFGSDEQDVHCACTRFIQEGTLT